MRVSRTGRIHSLVVCGLLALVSFFFVSKAYANTPANPHCGAGSHFSGIADLTTAYFDDDGALNLVLRATGSGSVNLQVNYINSGCSAIVINANTHTFTVSTGDLIGLVMADKDHFYFKNFTSGVTTTPVDRAGSSTDYVTLGSSTLTGGIPTYNVSTSPGAVGSARIQLYTPYDGLSTPNFNRWQSKITINGDDYSSYWWTVDYWDTGSPSTVYTDDLLSQFGTVPLNKGDLYVDTIHILTKATSLSSGTFQAKPKLFVIKTSDTTTQIFEGDTIDFTVVSGDTVTYTETPQSPDAQFTWVCEHTDFRIDWTGATYLPDVDLDFGQGFCEVMRYLFKPSSDVLAKFQTLRLMLQQTAPISYFYEVNTIFDHVDPNAATLEGLTINTGTSTPIQIEADLFSADTIEKYTDSTSRALVRTIIEYSLYLLFITAVSFTTINAFKKA